MILKEESKCPFQANHKGQPTKEQNLWKKVSPIVVLFQVLPTLTQKITSQCGNFRNFPPN